MLILDIYYWYLHDIVSPFNFPSHGGRGVILDHFLYDVTCTKIHSLGPQCEEKVSRNCVDP